MGNDLFMSPSLGGLRPNRHAHADGTAYSATQPHSPAHGNHLPNADRLPHANADTFAHRDAHAFALPDTLYADRLSGL